MLTHTQIAAEEILPALSETQVHTLSLLVKRYPPYRDASGMWPDLAGKFAEEVATPTVKTQALKAVLTGLAKIPSIVVESDGTSESQSHFSTNLNWYELAELVLNTLYDIPIATGRQSVAVVPVRITDLTLRERTIVTQRDTGRRY